MPYLGQLRFDNIAIERFHNEFVRTGAKRFLNAFDIVFRGAKYDNRFVVPASRRGKPRKPHVPLTVWTMRKMFPNSAGSSGVFSSLTSSTSRVARLSADSVKNSLKRSSMNGPIILSAAFETAAALTMLSAARVNGCSNKGKHALRWLTSRKTGYARRPGAMKNMLVRFEWR